MVTRLEITAKSLPARKNKTPTPQPVPEYGLGSCADYKHYSADSDLPARRRRTQPEQLVEFEITYFPWRPPDPGVRGAILP